MNAKQAGAQITMRHMTATLSDKIPFRKHPKAHAAVTAIREWAVYFKNFIPSHFFLRRRRLSIDVMEKFAARPIIYEYTPTNLVSVKMLKIIAAAPRKKYKSVFFSQFIELSIVVVIIDMHIGRRINAHLCTISPLSSLENRNTPISPPRTNRKGIKKVAMNIAALTDFSTSYLTSEVLFL